MKHIIILGDGMSDWNIPALNNQTPLAYARTPNMDLLARLGTSGLLQTVPNGYAPGSEVAHLSLLGYDLDKVYEGRASLEAASMGVVLEEGELAIRCNLLTIEDQKIKNHSAGHISTEEANELISFLQEQLGDSRVTFHAGVSYRHLLVIKGGDKRLQCTPPHDVPNQLFEPLLVKPLVSEAAQTANLINHLIQESQRLLATHPINLDRMAAGKEPANSIWTWSPGYKPNMETLSEKYGIKHGAVISAVDLIHGLGIYAGLKSIQVSGATGLYNTNYANKVAAALEALQTVDFVFLHIEASDEAGHEGNVTLKVKTIEDLDSQVVGPIYEATKGWKEPVSIAILPDHATPCETRTHTSEPVPFLIYTPQGMPDEVTEYNEIAAKKGAYGLLQGDQFMHYFIKQPEIMHYYSTNKQAPMASLQEAVIKGLAQDKGLFMPQAIPVLPDSFFERMETLSFQEIALEVATAFFGEDVEASTLKEIVYETLSFDTPVVHIKDRIYSLELFHGPTLAFKDVGGRFMARLLRYFIQKEGSKKVNVLVATSGDTGSAVANGFLGVPGIRVFVLYPKGKVSDIQEKQFTTLGQNITALEVDGTFDDCQVLVKSAFMDEELNKKLMLTSANSINVARFLPQSFYYFYAYAQLKKLGVADQVVFSVPSGNFGNLTAGLFAKRMGLPVKRFIAANNENDIFLKYLQTGIYTPAPSIPTIANAMDVGDPSNFARILDLYNHDHQAIIADVSGVKYSDQEIRDAVQKTYQQTGYLLDPHGACGYQALNEGLKEGETGVFLETAHPSKFLETVEEIIQVSVAIPDRLQTFLRGEKQSIQLANDFEAFKEFLMGL